MTTHQHSPVSIDQQSLGHEYINFKYDTIFFFFCDWSIADNGAAWTNLFHTFHYLWYIAFSLTQTLFDIVYLSFSLSSLASCTRHNVANAFAGNLKLSVRFICPYHCSLRLCIFHTSVSSFHLIEIQFDVLICPVLARYSIKNPRYHEHCLILTVCAIYML